LGGGATFIFRGITKTRLFTGFPFFLIATASLTFSPCFSSSCSPLAAFEEVLAKPFSSRVAGMSNLVSSRAEK